MNRTSKNCGKIIIIKKAKYIIGIPEKKKERVWKKYFNSYIQL